MARTKILDEDLANNRSKLIPMALCIDTSYSMNEGTKKADLEAAIAKFYQDVETDPRTRYGADICIVEFNDRAGVFQEFTRIDDANRAISIAPGGNTNMGAGVNLALDKLADRREYYKQAAGGRRAARPTLVLMTDGASNVDPDADARAIQRVNDLVSDRKLVVITIAIGDDDSLDWKTLVRFSPEIPPLQIDGLASFKEFFKVLSDSMSRAAQEGSDAAPDIESEDIEELVPVETLKQVVPELELSKYVKYKDLFSNGN